MIQESESSTTENGALGYKTTGNALLDLSYFIPDFRRGEYHMGLFVRALDENLRYTLKWLLYLRDIEQGCGERNAFRVFFTEFCNRYDSSRDFLENVSIVDFGRWDDLTYIYSHTLNADVKDFIGNFLNDELKRADANHSTLLAKWLPSESSKNNATKLLAKELRKKYFKMSAKTYRKTLSALRAVCAPTEVKMSARRWGEIDYSQVPSVANLKYSNAFLQHDYERRTEFLSAVSKGKVKINANSAFLYDIVHKYNDPCNYDDGLTRVVNETLEQMWEAQEKIEGFSNTLIVRDGSWSMTDFVSGSISAMEVADSLSVYCAEQNTGAWHNRLITFSANPQTVEFSDNMTLLDKLTELRQHSECSNTNIEKTFDLILGVAVENNLSQAQLPNVLIISDMEFDVATYSENRVDNKLFAVIADKFKQHGYVLPKLIFWNVCSRTNTIPLRENDLGVILVSGFSKSILNMVIQDKTDPWEALKGILDSSRYSDVDAVYGKTCC